MAHTGMKFGIFLAPFHRVGENPTLALARDMELIEWLDHLGYDEVWVGEHHSAGWETIASPEVFIAAAAERTRHMANRFVLLDHMTRGRTMLGCGPGALVSDAYMMGIEPVTQRPRMEEALEAIMRLLRCDEPVTMKTDWFELREARLHLAPYTEPHFPIAVASTITPFGMVAAGKYGLGVLSIGAGLPGGPDALAEQWKLAEETAGRHGKRMDRKDWRVVVNVHVAEDDEGALHEVQRAERHETVTYFEETLGRPPGVGQPRADAAELRALRPVRHASLPGLPHYRPGVERVGAGEPQDDLRPQRGGRAPRLPRCWPRDPRPIPGAHLRSAGCGAAAFMRLAGRVALITGGASGMGRSEATIFAREGAKVVVGDLLEAEGSQVAADIAKTGAQACFVKLDVTREADWRDAIATTVVSFGKLHVLVNNAGISGTFDPDTESSAAWDTLMDVNAKGVFLGMKHAVPAMRQAGGGAIVNISSISGFVGQDRIHMGYNASKGAVRLMTKSAAVQYAKDGIRVNSVHPGIMPPMRTSKVSADPEWRAKTLRAVPMKREGRVEEVAYAVLFLASDEASYITGTELVVDGGYLAV